jgi:hypothetical protein
METQFVRFTFPKITTKLNAKGIEKKITNNLPTWKDITKDNYNNYVKPKHTGHAIITGEINNITVLDFDDKTVYNLFVSKYPYLTNHYTVETKNGFHIYFLYNNAVPTTTNAFYNFEHIDIRNNDAIVYAPPTKYTLLDGSIVEYKFIGGEILPFTEEILQELKINKPKIAKPLPIEVIAEKIEKLPCIKIKNNVEEDAKYAQAIIENGLLNTLADDHDNWRNVGFALKNIFRNFNNTLGLQLFKAFSSVSEKYNELECEEYWTKNLNNISSKKPITIGSLKKWARECDSIKYKIIQQEVVPKEDKKKNEVLASRQKDEETFLELIKKSNKNENGDFILPSKKIIEKKRARWLYSGCMNDKEASEKLFELYPFWITCQGELYVFDYTTGMYSSNTIIYNKIITAHTIYLHIMLKDESHNREWYTSENRSYGNTSTLLDKIVTFMKTLNVNDDWLKQSQSSSLGKILFENGYYDFKTQIFNDIFNPEFVFFGKIHHSFTPFDDDDMEYIESIKQRLFYDSMGKEVGDYFILNLARGLSGECMKRILFAIGDTNCGKGVITTGVSLSLGDYFGPFNAESLAHRESSQDEAQIMRWVLLLRYKRIIISNEMKSGITLNGNFIKKICSGGDTLIGRTHCKEETEFNTHFLPIILDNDMNKITPYDNAINDRVRCLIFPKQFVDTEPQNQFELKMDLNIKEELKTLRFQKCFVGMLLYAHLNYCNNNKQEQEPDAVRNSKKDLVETTTDINWISGFLRDYEITNNVDDYIVSSSIELWIKDKQLNISMVKFSRDIKKYNTIKKLDNVNNIYKKIGKKTIRCWVGIKQIDDEVEEFDA